MALTRERRKLGAPPAAGIDAANPNPYGWAPLAVLFIVGLVDRIENNLLSGVLPLLKAEWGFSDTAAGSIPTAAALAAAIVSLPAGYLADRHNRTRIITVVVFCWAIATLGSGLATGFAIFYLTRVFLAAAENIDNPASGSLLADYYPPATRAQAYGLTRITTYLGGIGTVIGGVIGEAYGWRTAFLVMVIPGLLTAWICWRLREPSRGELDRIIAGATPTTTRPAAQQTRPHIPFIRQAGQVLRIPTLLMVSIGLMLLTFGLTGVYYWLPSLMVRDFGLGAGTAGTISGTISIVGVLAGTLIGARLGRHLHGIRKGGRLLVGGTGIATGSLVLGGALLAGDVTTFVLLTGLSSILMSTAIPNLTASLADVVDATSRGLAFAVLQLLMTLGTAFGPLVVGIASDASGSLLTAMYVLIVPMFLGGVLTLTARASFERDSARVLETARHT
ncbi:MFS transporter [Microtetraspora sp. NBRC 13810]|uniref:MFS transporter n=1 Tax=Microtetraspora sp. NBRC 13810 TaxID=3030990 RepID=UPI0024A192CD|nr:MFS transporter [Microtetraspora sp. NBRC 13810]GLW06894.1 MFS transporter [Microtetraspora sp. NBRC 13810]